MRGFLLSRFIQAVLTLLLVSVVIFILGRILGDPLDVLLPLDSPPEVRERAAHKLGLDQPLVTQYFVYMGNLVQGDFGRSIRTNEPVINMLRQRIPASLQLALVSMLLTVIVAFPLGIISAVKRDTNLDVSSRFVALLGQSVPAFWIGIIFIWIFAVQLGWLPAAGIGGPAHYILPALTMSLFVIAGMTRLLRNSMLEVLDSEFIKFARIKGLSENWVIGKHAVRNALIPVLSFGGVYFSILITQAIVVEAVFAWPGMGRLAFNAIKLRDFPVMQGVILTTALIVITVNFAVDILYVIVDPRIRYGEA